MQINWFKELMGILNHAKALNNVCIRHFMNGEKEHFEDAQFAKAPRRGRETGFNPDDVKDDPRKVKCANLTNPYGCPNHGKEKKPNLLEWRNDIYNLTFNNISLLFYYQAKV